MTVHKLSAGDGYTYLTRQVASADEPRAPGQSLADYYVARGNPPGVWWGGGARQLGVEGTVVTEAQMRALFGQGRHPNGVDKLGAAYPNYNGHGRKAVAGYDLVFSPVKSASVLWALGGPEIRQAVEDAHHNAVRSTLEWIETHAAYTRAGHGGVAQVDTRGLVCAAFDHRESRSGDPDLHTHVAVANKVCGVDGKWRSLDARGLYALGVAASERYNTRFEAAMADRLGVAFAERLGLGPEKRPIREVVGVPVELIRHFSRRRIAIEERYSALREEYRATHGREPGRAARVQLAQQATLETREGKPAGRTLAEHVAGWTAQARQVAGTKAVAQLADACVGHDVLLDRFDDDALLAVATTVVRRVAEQRSTWTVWNLYAEAERTLRSHRFSSPQDRDRVTEAVVSLATGPRLSIRITAPELIAEAPALLRSSDAHSVFVSHGSDRFTTSEILLAEDRLVAAARFEDAPHLDDVVLSAALAIHASTSSVTLDPGQRDLVRAFATSPARLVVGIGPAGTGKTTAMRAFSAAWHANGGRVVPLASSAKAAEVLGTELGIRSENLHKFLFEATAERGPVDNWFELATGDVVLVDEAGMAGTLQLATLVDLATAAGATVRLLGDPAQLASVEAGGALGLLESEAGATYLTEIHRFSDPEEGSASMKLRWGDADALAFYSAHGRISGGTGDAMLDAAYAGWANDVRNGMTSALIATSAADVSALNARARAERVTTGEVEIDGAELHDGNLAGTGDWVVTRKNARTLCYRRNSWVRNGDTWRVLHRHADGSITVQHLTDKARLRLPTEYVRTSVELAYATTAHRVQGTTTDTAHTLVTAEMCREQLYVASTRGREGTHWYVANEHETDLDCTHEPRADQTALQVLAGVLARTGEQTSATQLTRTVLDEATHLPGLIARYEHARALAARDSLEDAARGALPAAHDRVLNDPATPHLADVLASAAARGAAPKRVLAAAFEMDEVSGARSLAQVLASRIQDYPHTLGIPETPATDSPLPWLPAPDVGHPGWSPYLRERAGLIGERLAQLGSLAAAYREQYSVTTGDPADLGPPPIADTRQSIAYEIARADLKSRPARARATQPRAPRPPTPIAPSRTTGRQETARLSR